MFALFLTLVLGLWLIPETAYAWGPAMHLSFGLETLATLSFLIPKIAKIINENRDDFLYGCLAPDIILGKRFTEYIHHCHNWDVGIKILKLANNEPNKQAFAYGYLTHLATDTIAHNYFVPYQLLQSYSARSTQHTYWEMRFDNFADSEMWKIAYKLAEKFKRSHHDDLLSKTLMRTFFSYKTNRRIFGSLLLLQNLKQWHHITRLIHIKSQFPISKKEAEDYKKLSLNAIYSFLNKGTRSRTYKNDPSGLPTIDSVRRIRRKLKQKTKEGSMTKRGVQALIQAEKDRLRNGLL